VIYRVLLRKLILVIALSCGVFSLAFAQTVTNSDKRKLDVGSLFDELNKGPEGERVFGDSIYVYPGSDYYPKSLAEAGVQGRVILFLDLSKDGHVVKASIYRSSGSSELDDTAIKKAMSMSYQGRGESPDAASLRLEFLKDNSKSVQSKTCKDFNVDAAWFKKTFPERSVVDLPSVAIIGNLVMLNYGSRDHDERVPVLTALSEAQCAAFEGCIAAPDKLLKDVFNEAMHQAIIGQKNGRVTCSLPHTSENNEEKLPRSILHTKLDEPMWSQTITITPDMPAYPQNLVVTGIQGQILLDVTITHGKTIKDIKVRHNQSGVSELADAAITHLRNLPFVDKLGTDLPEVLVIVPVEFKKDTESSIDLKICADFNIDAAAWKTQHPQAELHRMNVMNLAREVLLKRQFESSPADLHFSTKARAQITASIAESTVEECGKQPQASFLKILIEQMEKTAVR